MRLLLSLLFALWSSTVSALCSGTSFMDRITDAERQQIADAVAETPYASGLHWTATKDGKTLHLIGTMHIADPRLQGVFDRTVASVEASELLLVEATAESEAEMQAAFAANPDMIFITEGPTLPELLDEDTWQALSAAVSARMVPPFLAAKMRPWYLSLTLAIPPCIIPELTAGERGLDHMLMDHAKITGVPVQALEDPLEVMQAISGGTFEEQMDALRLSLLTPELQTEMFVAMLNSYFAEDIAEVWEASRLAVHYVPELTPERAEALFEEVEVALLKERNLDWIPVIEAAFEDHNTVTLAAGAAHLPGEFGVLKLLEHKGWAISRD